MVIKENAKITSYHFRDAKNFAYELLGIISVVYPKYSYHGKSHTTDFVVPNTIRLSKKEKFSTEHRVLASIAAVFHDTGFLERYVGHELASARFAKQYLSSQKCKYAYSPTHIQLIVDAIEETDLMKQPTSSISEVLRDADLSYLGLKRNYMKWNEKLKAESITIEESPLHDTAIDDMSWYASTIEFVNNHSWFTKGAQILFEKNKKKNLYDYKKMALTYLAVSQIKK